MKRRCDACHRLIRGKPIYQKTDKYSPVYWVCGNRECLLQVMKR